MAKHYIQNRNIISLRIRTRVLYLRSDQSMIYITAGLHFKHDKRLISFSSIYNHKNATRALNVNQIHCHVVAACNVTCYIVVITLYMQDRDWTQEECSVVTTVLSKAKIREIEICYGVSRSIYVIGEHSVMHWHVMIM